MYTAAATASSHTPLRGTQSLVHIIAACWRRPSLLLREVAWRWLFGIPTLLLIYLAGRRLLTILLAANTGIASFSLEDPFAATQVVAAAASAIEPEVTRLALRVLPVIAIAWAIASGIGRGLVLRALEPRVRPASLNSILLQLVRIAALGGSIFGWFAAVRWAAQSTLYQGEPNLVGYFALVICLSLGIFTLWALLSWIFSIAPLLALLEGHGVLGSMRESLRLGPLRGKLVEVNLVLGIVKLALVVLAMVFSATPLPFESVMHGAALYWWWAGVSVLYLVASDFFQVARLAAFVEFWRVFRGDRAALISRGTVLQQEHVPVRTRL